MANKYIVGTFFFYDNIFKELKKDGKNNKFKISEELLSKYLLKKYDFHLCPLQKESLFTKQYLTFSTKRESGYYRIVKCGFAKTYFIGEGEFLSIKAREKRSLDDVSSIHSKIRRDIPEAKIWEIGFLEKLFINLL